MDIRPNNSVCVEHNQSPGKNTYATTHRCGKKVGKHVVAYEDAYGVPVRGVMRHTCGNRRCINPLHLVDGTPRQNTRDAIRDGTFYASSPITPQQKTYILQSSKSIRELGRELGVSSQSIHRVRRQAKLL